MNSDEVHLGEITFNTATRALVDQGGGAVALRHKSKEVLAYLVQNPGRVVSKSEMMEAIWTDVTVSDESLVQCIADIRRVIGPDARQIVETVPREGYRLNVPTTSTPSPRRFRWTVPFAALAAGATGLVLWFSWPEQQAEPALLPAPQEVRTSPPGTEVVDAYLEVLKGRLSADQFSEAESLVAERHFRRAIELDPTYARAYAELGTLFAVRFENDWTALPDADKRKALFYAEKAIELDPDLWQAHYALGRLQSVLANYDAAVVHLERAMALKPDSEDARAYYGIVRGFQGDAEAAVAILDPVLASHPNPPYWYYLGLGNALFITREYERAERALTICLDLATNSPYCLRFLIAVYGELGLTDKAAEAARAYASMGFDPSIGAMISLLGYLNPNDKARLESAYRLAGLPD